MRQREAAGGEPGGSEPEFRLPPSIAGTILVFAGLMGFAWTTYPFVSKSVPANLYLVPATRTRHELM